MTVISPPKLLLGTLTIEQQQRMLAEVRAILQQAPLYTAELKGTPFKYRQSGAGWGWTSGHGGGYRYQQHHPILHTPLPPIPASLLALAKHFGLEADALLINVYTEKSSLGLHQDRDERDLTAPVISISLGDTAEFMLGGPKRSDPATSHWLESGAVMQLAGENRLAFHGVSRVLPGTAPKGLLRRDGRINLTLRKSQ